MLIQVFLFICPLMGMHMNIFVTISNIRVFHATIIFSSCGAPSQKMRYLVHHPYAFDTQLFYRLLFRSLLVFNWFLLQVGSFSCNWRRRRRIEVDEKHWLLVRNKFKFGSFIACKSLLLGSRNYTLISQRPVLSFN